MTTPNRIVGLKGNKPMVSEFQIQSTFIECLAHLHPDCVYFAVPNEAKRSLREGARMKKLGLHPGAADMVFLARTYACVIEFKTLTGTQTKEQREFEAWCVANGIRYRICRTVRDALWTLGRTWGLIHNQRLVSFLEAFKEPGTDAN